MATATKTKNKKSKAPGRRRKVGVHKPRGVLHPRVQKVQPQHFGIVCVDPAQAKSKWMLCDFYGNMLIEPTELPHTSAGFAAAILQLRHALEKHQIKDQVVAIERTGNYHLPVKRAFAAAGFECRIIHPFATKQFRQPADPGNKTDDTDMAAQFRATVSGFGLIELELDPLSRELRLVERHRRDLIYKRSAVCCQMREHLAMTLPGFAACFDDLWHSDVGLYIARNFSTPESIHTTGVPGLAVLLKQAKYKFHTPTLEKIVAWARTATAPDADAAVHHRILVELDDDRRGKTRQITALEGDLVRLMVQTPYVLLLSVIGVNVVSAAELAGEMGPIGHYANARAITGRSGLFPARYQSDDVDLKDGHLVRCCNRSLRAVLLMVAGNLRKCNPYYRAMGDVWKAHQEKAERIRIKIASRATRVFYQIVAGGQVFHHPIMRRRSYLVEKLLHFHREHQIAPEQMLANLQHAVQQLPRAEHPVEGALLYQALLESQNARRPGPQLLADILPLVLAKMGAGAVQSNPSGDKDPS